MQDARLIDRLRPDVVNRLGQPFEAVADDDTDILDVATSLNDGPTFDERGVTPLQTA
jgi:hypothetical protein